MEVAKFITKTLSSIWYDSQRFLSSSMVLPEFDSNSTQTEIIEMVAEHEQ